MLFTNIKNRFSTLDKRSAIVIKNSMATALMKVAVLLCSLIMVPITLNYLNAENYGIWMAMTSILYWFAFFDVGLGNGMRNYLSEAISRQDYIKARSYFSTAIFLLAIIAVLIGILSIIIIFQLDLNHIFNTHIMSNKSLAYIMVVAISFSLIQFVAKNVGMVYCHAKICN